MTSMITLQRHYLMRFAALFATITGGLTVIISLVVLTDKLDQLLPHDPTIAALAGYALYAAPKQLSYLLPLAAMVSGLFTVGQAARHKEIVAVMSAGGRIKHLLLPFVAAGILLSIAAFLLGEFVVPEATARAEAIRFSLEGRSRQSSLFRDGTIWLRSRDGRILHIGLYDQGSARNLSIFRTEGGELVERMEAEKGRFEKDHWLLLDVDVYSPRQGGYEKKEQLKVTGMPSPDFLKREVKDPEDMGIVSLYRYVSRLREAGIQNLKLIVDMHAKVSYPLINFFMLLIGISFGVKHHLSGMKAGAMGIGISLLYWICYTMALATGYAGIVPPVIAAWIMPALFGAGALKLYLTIPE